MPAFSILFFWRLCSLSGIDVQSKKLLAPRISIKPNAAFSLGDNGRIVCEVPFFSSFSSYLEKDGQEISSKEGSGGIGFPITSASKEHGGIYTCYYKDLRQSKSERSESVELLIRDPDLPRPSIYLSPSRMAVLGDNIIIICRVKGPSKSFYVDMGGNEKTMELYEDFAYFRIDNIDWDNGRSYHCSYSSQSGFFISEPSDPVELLIVDPRFPKPSISLSPTDGVTVGSNVTIDCRSQDLPKSFYLRKLRDQMTGDEPMQANGTSGKFLISNASLDHRGNYSCSYHPRSEPFSVSEPSDPVELLITDPDLLKPTISLRPTGIAQLRSNITIHCSTNGSFVVFHLYKSGDLMKSQPMEPDGDGAMFSINNISIEDSGVYHCCYKPSLQTFFISESSNHMELLVLDPSLPRPEISITPTGQAAHGGQVNIKCESKDGPARFFLHKAEDSTLKWPMKNVWDVGEIFISSISSTHQRNYSCSYALDIRPSAFSAHSDPVQLLVSEPPDYTWINILCFAIGGLILLLLAYIVIGDHHFWKEQQTRNVTDSVFPASGSLSFPINK